MSSESSLGYTVVVYGLIHLCLIATPLSPSARYSLVSADSSFYSGSPPLNRLSFVRSNADILNGHFERAKFLIFSEGKPLVHLGKINLPFFLSASEVAPLLGSGFSAPSSSATEQGLNVKAHEAKRDGCILVFLGVDERGCPTGEDLLKPHGIPYFAIDATPAGTGLYAVKGDAEDPARQGKWTAPEGSEWADARMSASLMDAWHAGLFASARPIVDWNARNRHCPACGRKTYSLWGGWKRSCETALGGPEERRKCFSNVGLHNFAHPRTDPVSRSHLPSHPNPTFPPRALPP